MLDKLKADWLEMLAKRFDTFEDALKANEEIVEQMEAIGFNLGHDDFGKFIDGIDMKLVMQWGGHLRDLWYLRHPDGLKWCNPYDPAAQLVDSRVFLTEDPGSGSPEGRQWVLRIQDRLEEKRELWESGRQERADQ